MICPNEELTKFRQKLNQVVQNVVGQWSLLSKEQKFQYLMFAADPVCNFYFSIFLDKVFKAVNKKTN